MKFLKALTVSCFFILSYQSISAASSQDNKYSQASYHENNTALACKQFKACDNNSQCPCAHQSHFGTAGFAVTDPLLWYPIVTNSYPETTPLSQNRNKGNAEGGVYLSPTGFTIGEAGNYWVSITAVLQNPAEEAALIPVFLVLDETFIPDDPSLIGSVVSLEAGAIDTAHGTGTLKNLAQGTRLSLAAANGGSPFPQSINVVAWSISLFKIP